MAESWRVLAPDERERAERYRLDEPRDRFVSSRAALRMLLGEYLGVPPAEVVFMYDGSGKPRLHDESNPDGLCFNLAHSGDLAVVVVARGCEVGIDVERLRAVSHWEQIARRYFHKSEVDEVCRSADALQGTAFLRCWTAKEAIVKAIGTGLSCPLTSFRVPVRQQRGEWVSVATSNVGPPTRCWLEQLTPYQGYVGAIACVESQRRLECSTVRMM
jgi:4'-phosphopantetheinyl transferase